MAMVEAGGNPNFLSPETESFRWQTDAALIQESTPDGTGYGVPDVDLLGAEVEAYAGVGVFGEGASPDFADHVDVAPLAGVYDDAGVSHLARLSRLSSADSAPGPMCADTNRHGKIDGVTIDHLRAAWDEMTAPGARLRHDETRYRGIPMRVFASALPNMRALWELSAVHGDKTYVVYEDERYTYAEIHAQVRALAHLLRDVHGVGARRPGRAGDAQLPRVGGRLLGGHVDRRRRRRAERVVDDARDGVRARRLAGRRC